MKENKVLLMILDGWGKSENPKTSAIDNANTSFIDSLYNKYPHANPVSYTHLTLPTTPYV